MKKNTFPFETSTIYYSINFARQIQLKNLPRTYKKIQYKGEKIPRLTKSFWTDKDPLAFIYGLLNDIATLLTNIIVLVNSYFPFKTRWEGTLQRKSNWYPKFIFHDILYLAQKLFVLFIYVSDGFQTSSIHTF